MPRPGCWQPTLRHWVYVLYFCADWFNSHSLGTHWLINLEEKSSDEYLSDVFIPYVLNLLNVSAIWHSNTNSLVKNVFATVSLIKWKFRDLSPLQ